VTVSSCILRYSDDAIIYETSRSGVKPFPVALQKIMGAHQWVRILREWYINGDALEHGYTLAAPAMSRSQNGNSGMNSKI